MLNRSILLGQPHSLANRSSTRLHWHLWFCILTFILIAFSNNLNASCTKLPASLITELKALPIQHHRLENGLRMYLLPRPSSGTVTLRTTIEVGGKDEIPGQSGYAHLFEHMMFKGTKQVPDGVFTTAVQSVGGVTNATTDYDRTQYWQSLPASFLKRATFLEADRMQNLVITEAKLNNQIEAVLEEKKLRLDNVPYAGVVSRFMVEQWQGTPYSHLLIGTDAELKAATTQSVSRFLDEYYVSKNAIITLVGQFNSANTLELLERYFKQWPSGRHNQAKAFSTVKQKKVNASLHDPLAPFPGYGIAWHTVGKKHPDYLGVEILTDALLRHSASRIRRILKEDKALVFELLGLPLTFEQVGLANMVAIPRTFASFSEIKEVVNEVLADIKKNGLKEDELCGVVKARQLDILRQASSNQGLAVVIGDGASYFGDPHYYLKLLERYHAIDNATLKRIANQYFTDEWMALQVTPHWTVRVAKWLLEVLPRPVGENLEDFFL